MYQLYEAQWDCLDKGSLDLMISKGDFPAIPPMSLHDSCRMGFVVPSLSEALERRAYYRRGGHNWTGEIAGEIVY
jgi:hypothetical protein